VLLKRWQITYGHLGGWGKDNANSLLVQAFINNKLLRGWLSDALQKRFDILDLSPRNKGRCCDFGEDAHLLCRRKALDMGFGRSTKIRRRGDRVVETMSPEHPAASVDACLWFANSRARIQAPDAQAMVARVEVRPNEQFTARFPKELCARITVRTKDQRVLVKEHIGYEGGLDNPLSWDRVVEKFHWLSEACADEDLRNRLIEAVKQLDAGPTSKLMDLLAQVRPSAVFPS
jgi:hypothetical protein